MSDRARVGADQNNAAKGTCLQSVQKSDWHVECRASQSRRPLTLQALLQINIKRHADVYFSMVLLSAACASRDILSTSFRTITLNSPPAAVDGAWLDAISLITSCATSLSLLARERVRWTQSTAEYRQGSSCFLSGLHVQRRRTGLAQTFAILR